ncbi:hypothetical protein BKA67DRAFT_536114 [Truncatella angustata]|uniref:Uncharacterized protein n=1 Tax=Truncatella angustata TaxID=152316 RepID=A0A9P8UMI3_9PEZI|nr:uncharacterized protein BKA67DRAFT_536114 [Truncatella angustata]KAH6654819.1 hypothetical protein BKA67DRAFT_536114 [Truncatella angustata]
MDFVTPIGAPFRDAVRDNLSKVTEIISPYGATKIRVVPEIQPPREDCAWHEFNPNYKQEMRPYGTDEAIFKMVILLDGSTKKSSALNHNLPGVTTYLTNLEDLFKQHPQRPTLFKSHGRRDNIIVLKNREKLNPIPPELVVQSYHRGLIIGGFGGSPLPRGLPILICDICVAADAGIIGSLSCVLS